MTRSVVASGHAEGLGIADGDLRHYIVLMVNAVRACGVEAFHVGDVVNDAFVGAIGKPKAERPDSSDREGFGLWLCRFAINAARTYLQTRRRTLEDLKGHDELEITVDPRNPFERAPEILDVAAVIDSFDSADARLFAQYASEEKTVATLADEHGVPWSTMRSRLDALISRVRLSLGVEDAPPARRRRRVAMLPLVFLGAAAREARAQLRALHTRLVASLSRSPMRVLTAIAGFAGVLALPCPHAPHAHVGDASTPHAASCLGTVERSAEASFKLLPARHDEASEGKGSPGADKGKTRKARSSEAFVERSQLVEIRANAHRLGDTLPPGYRVVIAR